MDRSKIVFAAIVAVVVIAAAALGFLAKGAFSAAAAADSEASQDYGRLQKIYAREVFPNDENVALLAKSVADLEACRVAITGALSKCNPPLPTGTSPSLFVQVLDKMVKSLVAKAPIVEGQKCVAPNFSFGFDSYYGGTSLPDPSEVPLLSQQLVIANRLANALFEAKVSKLVAFRRDAKDSKTVLTQQSSQDAAFTGRPAAEEEPVQQTRGKKGKKNAEPEVPLFTCQRFGVEFMARDSALVDFLNAIASMKDLFIVVTDMSVKKDGVDVKAPSAELLSADADKSRDRDARRAEMEARRAARAERASRSSARPRRDRPQEPVVEEKAQPKPTELPAELRKVSGPELDPLLSVKLQLEIYSFGKEGE